MIPNLWGESKFDNYVYQEYTIHVHYHKKKNKLCTLIYLLNSVWEAIFEDILKDLFYVGVLEAAVLFQFWLKVSQLITATHLKDKVTWNKCIM